MMNHEHKLMYQVLSDFHKKQNDTSKLRKLCLAYLIEYSSSEESREGLQPIIRVLVDTLQATFDAEDAQTELTVFFKNKLNER